VKSIRFLLFISAAVWCGLASAEKDKPLCVGYASIDRAGVIHLDLISSEETHGGAMLILDEHHPLYGEMRKHIGKLKVGRWKCLKSLPETSDFEEPAKGDDHRS
jgi:hypothetical protein